MPFGNHLRPKFEVIYQLCKFESNSDMDVKRVVMDGQFVLLCAMQKSISIQILKTRQIWLINFIDIPLKFVHRYAIILNSTAQLMTWSRQKSRPFPDPILTNTYAEVCSYLDTMD